MTVLVCILKQFIYQFLLQVKSLELHVGPDPFAGLSYCVVAVYKYFLYATRRSHPVMQSMEQDPWWSKS